MQVKNSQGSPEKMASAFLAKLNSQIKEVRDRIAKQKKLNEQNAQKLKAKVNNGKVAETLSLEIRQKKRQLAAVNNDINKSKQQIDIDKQLFAESEAKIAQAKAQLE